MRKSFSCKYAKLAYLTDKKKPFWLFRNKSWVNRANRAFRFIDIKINAMFFLIILSLSDLRKVDWKINAIWNYKDIICSLHLHIMVNKEFYNILNRVCISHFKHNFAILLNLSQVFCCIKIKGMFIQFV